ncbi:MAG: sensor domain-containing diguanylate cyclase [Sphingomonadales bacterium]
MVKVASLDAVRTTGSGGDGAHLLDAAAFLATFSGPALLVDRDYAPLRQNAHGEIFTVALDDGESALRALLERTFETGIPNLQKLAVTAGAGVRHFEVYAVPLRTGAAPRLRASRKVSANNASLLVFGRETTLDHNLTRALVESRQMFKDLVGCSADFAWETDAQGVLRYVSPGGAFGYRALELTGRCASDLMARDLLAKDHRTACPFTTRERVTDHLAALICADGSRADVRITATPVLNQKGEWLGARGMCRIPEPADADRTVNATRETRLDLNLALTALVRDMVASGQLISGIARTVSEHAGLPCHIFRRQSDGFIAAGGAPDPLDASIADTLCREIGKLAGGHRSRARHVYTVDAGGRPFQILPAVHDGHIAGALAVPCTAADMDDALRTLFDDAVDHLGIALDLVINREAVRQMTRTDELTGLLTAEAFAEDVTRRLAHQRRTNTGGSVLMVAIDDFGAINERFGFPCGEVVLRQVGEILEIRSRVGDLAARLEGGTFALWLEDTSERGAGQKARMVINAARGVTAGPPGQGVAVSVSVGGAMGPIGGRSRSGTLLARARNALDAAREDGRGHWTIIPDMIPDQISGDGDDPSREG